MIYKEINCKGIIHAHPSYTVALSFFLPQILPKDMEGQYFFESVPVLSSVKEQEFLDALAREHIVVLRGHGTFAAGNSLDEALLYTCALESSARLIYLCSIYERRGNDKL
jgi:L-fuculose-phosphate aldolase